MVKWKKTLGASILSAGLVFSSFAPATFAKESKALKLESFTKKRAGSEAVNFPFLRQHKGGPFDLGLTNEEKVLKLLIKQGIVSKNGSPEEQKRQMQAYLSKRAEKADKLGTNQQELKKLRTNLQKKAGLKLKPAGIPKNAKGKVSPKTSSNTESIEKENWTGPVRKDKVLVLLMEFKDFPHNSIKPEDDPVLMYDDYTQKHYEDMIFGDKGYDGPNGQNLISVKQYYEQQSGGSYTIEGQVSKWYKSSKDAAYYGANGENQSGNDQHPQELISEALAQAAQDPEINLNDYDVEDQYDLDGDGDYHEPDGIIDHLMVVHSGIGEEAAGGSLGPDAIWSHSSTLPMDFTNGIFPVIPNTQTTVPYWGGSLIGFTYTIQPEDGATGVYAHEFGHDLGLPDEYDTNYTADSVGAPTEYWSIMSAGSWAGKINGTEPSGFSPYDKEYLGEVMPELNWFNDAEYTLNDLRSGKSASLDEASVKGKNLDAVKIKLPDKAAKINTPPSGRYEYFSGSDNSLQNVMLTTVNLKGKTTAQLTFKTWYQIEEDFDYAYVWVSDDGINLYPIRGNITTNNDPNQANQGNGITGSSPGWVNATFDLSAFAGKEIYLGFAYFTDPYVSLSGFFVDDIQVKANGTTVFSDNADGQVPQFQLFGFEKNDGTKLTSQYYLAEWRNYAGADEGLKEIKRGHSFLSYDPGLVLWYVDNKYTENWVGDHPGDGFLGVVDAHQTTAKWKDTDPNDNADWNRPAETRYQIQDAAFSLSNTDNTYLDYQDIYGRDLTLGSQPAESVFDDSKDYSNPGLIYAGRNVPKMGLNIQVTDQADDMSVGTVKLSTNIEESVALNSLSKTVYSNIAGYNKVTVTGKVKGMAGTSVKYEVLDSAGKVVTSLIDRLNAKEQSYNETLTLPTKTPTGNYTVKVTAGPASKQLSFKVDNDAPKVTASPNGSTAPIKEAAAKVTVSDANLGTLGYVWSQSTKAPSSGYKSFTNGSVLKQPGKNGKWYLYVQAKDKVGNSTTWKSNSFNLDSAKPTVTISPNGSTKPAKSVSPKVTVKDSNLSSYGYAWTKSAAAPKSGYKSFKNGSKLTLSKVTGKYYLHVYAKDKAGNAVTFNSKSFVLDNTAPGKPQVDKIVSKKKLVTGHAEKGAKIKIKAGKTTVTGYVNSKGKYSIKLKKAFKVGTTVYVTATDTAGNTSKTTKKTVTKK